MPRGIRLDLTGQVFGLLTVLEKDVNYKKEHNLNNKLVYWKCRCECGNITTVGANALTSGNTRSCGCLNYNRYNDLTGQRFNMLTVLEKDYDANRRDRHMFWKCKCDCGKIVSISGSNLLRGAYSCGCYNSTGKIVDITGETFGALTVLEFVKTNDQRDSLWLCQCKCGKRVVRSKSSLRSESYSSCGCITMSNGVKKIENILLQNNITFVREQTFDSCRFPDTNALARFDFYINNEFLLEFDGAQHYGRSEKFFNYETIHEHDIFKNNWCFENNIKLKRIPYWALNKITLQNILDDTFLIQKEETTDGIISEKEKTE